jgi:hypothetical protein
MLIIITKYSEFLFMENLPIFYGKPYLTKVCRILRQVRQVRQVSWQVSQQVAPVFSGRCGR